MTTFKHFRSQRSLQESNHATCDVILRCGSSASLPVHSCFLVAVSRFFRRLLGSQTVNKRSGQSNISVGIAGGALDVVMNFFIVEYTLLDVKCNLTFGTE